MIWIKRLLLLAVVVLLCGFLYQQWAEHRDARLYPPPGELVSIGDYRLHIRCIGEDTPTVLIISGSGTASVTSYDVQDRIGEFARVCSYDRTGLGWSDPLVPMGLAEMTDDLERLVEAAGEDGPYILVPESFGGMIALGFAQRHPDRVAGIVFVDSSEPQLWFEGISEQPGGARIGDLGMQFAWRIGLVRLVYPWFTPDWVETMSPRNQALLASIWSRPISGYSEFIAVAERTGAEDIPGTPPNGLGDMPVIVLVHDTPGALNPAFEAGWAASQRRLAALSSNSRLIVAEDTGHMIAGENPELVVDAIRWVMDETGAADDR